MHSSYGALRNEIAMNCGANEQITSFSSETEHDIERILVVWRHCKRFYGQDGKWLFSQFTIADAMFAPIAIRLHTVDFPMQAIEAEYRDTLYNSQLPLS